MENNIAVIKKLASKLDIDELKSSLALLESEYNKRKQPKLAVYTHDCHQSAYGHQRRYQHWCKYVTGIDNTKTNGYAFIGDFLSVKAEHMLPIGSIVVEVCDDIYTAYKITEDYTKEKIDAKPRGALYPLIKSVSGALKKHKIKTGQHKISRLIPELNHKNRAA